jgi:hypothetical protein
MKIQRFNEKLLGLPVYRDVQSELESNIADLIHSNVEMQTVKYSDDMEISYKSIEIASKEIFKYIIENITPEIINEFIIKKNSEKYNL